MAYTDREDLNYLGILYGVGAEQTNDGVYTPFLSAIGGLQGGRAATSSNFTFPTAQPWSLAAASQDTQSEATAAAEGTPTTTTRAQDTNVCQIMKDDREVSYFKQAAIGEISGVTAQGGTNPVVNELGFQKGVGLMQLAVNANFSCLQGTYVASSLASTNQTTRGLSEAIATNTVAAGSVDLSKALIDELVRTMAASKAITGGLVAIGDLIQIQRLNDIYGFQPTSYNVGGVDIESIKMPGAGNVGVMYDPLMPSGYLYLVKMAQCRPMFVPHDPEEGTGQQLISWTDKGKIAAKKGGFWTMVFGLDYGAEESHGLISGLTTS